jgi:hypothetical protein
MIDFELTDRMFEIGHQNGQPIVFVNFDKRVLLSLEQVATDISSATGKSITYEDLTRMEDLGWIPLLSDPHDPGSVSRQKRFGEQRVLGVRVSAQAGDIQLDGCAPLCP